MSRIKLKIAAVSDFDGPLLTSRTDTMYSYSFFARKEGGHGTRQTASGDSLVP